MPTNPPKASAGFTLLEMIVAFVILSISLVVATQAIAIASQSSAAADEMEMAIELVAGIRANRQTDGAGDLLDGRGRAWKISLRRPAAQTLVTAETFAVTLTSPRGVNYVFLVPDDVSAQAGEVAQ